MAKTTKKSETPKTRREVVAAAGRLGLETSGRGEVWTLYAGDRFHKLAAPENLHEVLTWAADIMKKHKNAGNAKSFQKLADIAEQWIEDDGE
jgi:hypothetical protein